MARVYDGVVWLERPLGGLERLIYRIGGINRAEEMSWSAILLAISMVGALGFLALFFIFMTQGSLPLNPQGFPGLTPDAAFNAAISFLTNTNWQSYAPETTLSYFSQSVGIVAQHFISPAVGMAVAVALFRGLARKETQTLGNAYADMVRSILYILMPMALVFAVFLVSQGVVQNYAPYSSYIALEGGKESWIAQGPAASQVAIKMLGGNGGGFFAANAAHPFENPTPLSGFLQLMAIFLLPAAFAYCFGVMVGDRRQGWMLLAAMTILFLPMTALAVKSEYRANPHFDARIVDQSAGNMEGKEIRFGAAESAFWMSAATATANGSANASYDSMTPMGGFTALFLMGLGEVVFGAVGMGMANMLLFVLLTVFMGGLMVGRTPEYMGKKLGAYEIKMASLLLLIPAVLILLGAAVAVSMPEGRVASFNRGAQGFSEILYGLMSAGNNNGSALGGLAANTPFYHVLLGIVMFLRYYLVMVPVLALAGALAAKKTVPSSAGTLPTHTPLFVFMLVGMVLMGALNFIPALVLGPVAEHIHLYLGAAS